jgi:glycosyltransferase involved in cell wall biosynthesis
MLQSLLALRSSFPWELIVVDNGSTDSTQEIIEQFKAQFPIPCISVIEQRKGLGIARNRGWSMASGEIIAFTDDDCYPDPDYLTSIVSCFEENPLLGFIGSRILLHDPTDFPITTQELNQRVDIPPRGFIAAGLIQGANFSCLRAALEDVSGFDEWFGAGALFPCEDIDIVARISAHGWAGAYDPRPLVYHHHRRKTLAQASRLMEQYDRGRGAYYVKCLLSPNLRATYGKEWIGQIRKQSKKMTVREIIAGGEYLARVIINRLSSGRKRMQAGDSLSADAQ